jgi:redox-sensitive bicupin YhaK (pirin superfamily)
MEGFQLWLNLPARAKMCEPGYRDIPARQIPSHLTADGVTIRAIAGGMPGAEAAVTRPDTEPVFLDLHMPEGARLDLDLPPGHNAFVYVYRGAMRIGARGEAATTAQMALLETRPEADGVALACDAAARAILVAGRPLGEPIAQYGPFVMNTREELIQAVNDFQSGRFA